MTRANYGYDKKSAGDVVFGADPETGEPATVVAAPGTTAKAVDAHVAAAHAEHAWKTPAIIGAGIIGLVAGMVIAKR